MQSLRHAVAWGVVLALIAGVMVIVARRPSAADPSATPAPPPQSGNLPRLDGSDSTRQLLRVVAARRLGLRYEWQSGPGGERYVAPDPSAAGGSSPLQSHVFDRLRTSNTRQAYVNLAEGRRDLIITVRPPSAEERGVARDAGAEFRIDPLVRLPVVVLLHADNPVSDLTADALRAVYAGRITDWSQLGGTAGHITAYQRRPTAVSTAVFSEKVMRGTPPAPSWPGAELIPAGDDRLFELVAHNPNAVAFTLPHPARIGRSPSVKQARIDGMPHDSPAYPLVTHLLVVTRADLAPTDPAASLRTWLLGREGRQILAECGYLP